MLNQLSALISPLVTVPTAPVFTLPLPFGKSLTVDLSIFDGVAACVRWAIGFVLTLAAMLGMVRFWRGVS
jgi:hypothetical protein